jgi:hypothetical protein
MPHTTHAYEFESKVGRFAGEVTARCSAGASRRSFLLALDPQGSVTELVFEDGSADWQGRLAALQSSGVSHLVYDPIDDGMEYVSLRWHAVEQSVMERLIGREFAASDFQPHPVFGSRAQGKRPPERFPSSWAVLF